MDKKLIVSRRTVVTGLGGALVAPMALTGCITGPLPDFPTYDPFPPFASLERRIGGRVGVSLVLADGRLRAGHRSDERFAMCSTFKAALAGAILKQVAAGQMQLDLPLAFTRADLVPYSPVVESALGDSDSAQLPLSALISAAVRQSDNAAANLLLRLIGGPAALTRFFRTKGDTVSRLDRYEVALNENAVGDPRDTTSPTAMAGLWQHLLLGNGLPQIAADHLTVELLSSTTGDARIRAGMPDVGWRVGDKTGTGPSSAPAYNDVAILFPPDDLPPAILAVYIDRPDADGDTVNAAIAEIGSIAVNLLV